MTAETGATPHPHAQSRWATNSGVRLHYLDTDGSGTDSDLTPLVFVPGFGEEALDHLELIEAMAPRRVVIADLRGRGPSDKPDMGYELGPHVADLDTIIEATGIAIMHIASYSRGTAYALRWAVDHPQRLASITVGDYPAAQIAPPHEVIPKLQANIRFGRPITDRVPAPIVAKVIEAAHTEWYYDDLSRVSVPLMVIHGLGRSGMVKEQAMEAYRNARPDTHFVPVDDGHDLWRRDPSAVPRALEEFLARGDSTAPG